MKKTYLFGTDIYVDMMCHGKHLYIYKWLWPKEITDRVVRIDRIAVGSRASMSSAVCRGVLGTMLLGFPGTVIGVAAAKQELLGTYKLTFEATFDVRTIEVHTRDPQLNEYLSRRAANIGG